MGSLMIPTCCDGMAWYERRAGVHGVFVSRFGFDLTEGDPAYGCKLQDNGSVSALRFLPSIDCDSYQVDH